MLCLGQFGVGLVGVKFCCVWDSVVWIWRSEGLVSVWDSLVWICGSVCVLCVGKFGVGLREDV